MDERGGKGRQPGSGSPRPAEERTDWGRQILGAIIGGAVVLVLGTAARQLGWIDQDLTRYVMWGAVIGALFGSSESLERAGQRLTRRDEPWLNIAVSLIGMAVAFALIYVISRGMMALIQRFG
ncbi:MAG: hypothetical protein MUF84_12760 [Anaerolineae bacterium]|jgi:hypothetical protein|nr:hypothetical protein [Anaerolineae bacterium]